MPHFPCLKDKHSSRYTQQRDSMFSMVRRVVPAPDYWEDSMAASHSFTLRIIMAMLLMVGFYVIAVAIALLLFYIPYAEIAFAGRIHIKLAILCVVGGCLILWSVLPRLDRFKAPGPLLTEKDQPGLFQQLRSVANATQQSMPVEVFALPEMNAWVSNRGGLMGIGSRRVMGLGVPLMQVLTIQQFRGVLAHEFGHYHSGDTKLGPWIFVTRSAIIRTVVNLSQNGSSILSKPFEWYLKLFLWITQRVSRHQEFTADALAAQVAGPDAIRNALKTIHSSAIAFGVYWEQEYVPVLNGGFRAPLARGFEEFFSASRIQKAVHDVLESELQSGKSDLYDSHPALKDRLAAIDKIIGPAAPPNDPPFISSLRGLDELESRMISHLAKALNEKIPDGIEWDHVTEKVWIPQWQTSIDQIGAGLDGLRLWQAVEMLRSPEHVSKLIASNLINEIPADDHKQVAGQVLQMAFAVALHREGWRLESPLGGDIMAIRDEHSVLPFEWLNKLMLDEITLEQFSQKCEATGTDSLLLKRAVS